MVIKLDMTKAYDRFSWLFLTKVLRKIGFCERFIGLIFHLVSNNWYSVLLNGQSFGFFKSTRAVKQGDPLSTTLFILAAEALSRGLNSLHRNPYFCSFGLPKWSSKINHLVYADDTIIFSSADATSLRLIMEVLGAYEATSGQLINKSKSALYMHHSTSLEVVNKRKLLSIGGRAVLITHLLKSMLIHLLSVVNPPNYVIENLHKIFAQFFWSNSVGVKSKHWSSWKNLCLPVEEGGDDFRSLQDVAKALFCKLWWNIKTKPTLWSSYMSQKYCKKLNAFVVPWRAGSHTWRRMLECRDLVEHQILWQPKMKFSLFWFDNWIGLGALYFVTPPEFYCDESIHNVYDVAREGVWDDERLREILPEDLAAHIIDNIKPPMIHEQIDKPYWMLESKGEFTVKLAWDYLRREGSLALSKKICGQKDCHSRYHFSCGSYGRGSCLLMIQSEGGGYFLPSRCWCCTNPEVETREHVFFKSYAASKVWSYFSLDEVHANNGKLISGQACVSSLYGNSLDVYMILPHIFYIC
ncbi:uncharacterized protein LOC142165180 [Nicotiana tabacum]|uniref:Uncharacterized protein LOC142165180 n=1 Tax=Nicotiana tabacum TaxID=4097 RepID=A0AC58S4K2_TOBAC